ncbi:Nucleic acid-binding protein [Glarea lozoyensis ATCC 20868]|uniref:Single-stranded DNA-binding protein n=1 Tax=Glarea lozoyensis (strain ATCC 20868 / MF5171) TaxID=1116229 RepID=S3DIM9_GLAL2|nr:Nucleic acid-binding protein [Glarea lozoyensis ATCC 20868]EPE31881.1 Nucleic acid-binding protein [Glarea lozoyensis ATCC 20868]
MSSFLARRALTASARSFSTSATRNSFAKMTIVGRLADTPELQATSTGREILRYAVATNSGPRDNQKSNFFKVTGFLPEGSFRDFITTLDKGTMVYVEGEVSFSNYEDAEGNKKQSLNIVQQKFEVLSSRKAQDGASQ